MKTQDDPIYQIPIHAHAEICPVCGGSGCLPTTNDYSSSAKDTPHKTCHGCGGCGWITVR